MSEEIIQDDTQEIADIVESQDPVVEESNEDTAEVASLDIPESWGNDLKEYINGIENPEARQAHYDKFKNFNDGHQKKFNDLANERKEFETQRQEHQTANQFYEGYKAFEGAIDPQVKASIVGQYGGVAQYSKWLHEQDMLISKDPVNYALQMLKGQGVTQENIGEYFGDSYNQYNTQREMGQQKEQSAQEMKQMFEQYTQQQEDAKTQAEVDTFINATTETGEPKHPHFKQVEGTMVALQQAYPEASYESLYDMACKTHPEVSQTYMQGQVETKANEIVNQKEVTKAKAVKGVKSSVDSVGKTANQGWQEHLEDQIDAG